MSDRTPKRVIHFTPVTLKDIAAVPDGEFYTDDDVSGLTVRATQKGKLAFTIIGTVRGRRTPHKLGKYLPGDLTVKFVNDLRLRAEVQLKTWRERGVAKKTTLTLTQMIDLYTEERLNGNILARKADGLPLDWDAQCTLIRKIFKPLVTVNICDLTTEDLKRAKTDYLKARDRQKAASLTAAEAAAEAATKKNKTLDDRSLAHSFSCLRQVLQEAIDQGFQAPGILAALKTRRYKKRPRFLLPGEWQRFCLAIDQLPHEAGLFARFLLATGARLSTALNFRWDQLAPQVLQIEDPRQEFGDQPHLVRLWRTKVKGDRNGLIHLVGETLRIIEHFDAQREASTDPADKNRETVFPQSVINLWRNKASFFQRQIELLCGFSRFSRHDLRRTLATYLKYAKLSQRNVSVALTHTLGPKGTRPDADASQATDHYTHDDTHFGDCLGDKEDLNDIDTGDAFEVSRAHLRVQALFKAMEAGVRTPLLKRTETTLIMGPNANAMILSNKINDALVTVQSPSEFAAWRATLPLVGWGMAVEAKHRAMKNKSARTTRKAHKAKRAAAATRATKSANALTPMTEAPTAA